MNIQNHIEKFKDCKLCTLNEGCIRKVFFRGTEKTNNLLIIGEAPGKEEDIIGIPFVGKSGKLLDKVLMRVFPENNFTITNAILCRPPDNRTPTKEEILACNPRLIEFIDIINPKLIICLGRVASIAVTNQTLNIKDCYDTIFKCRRNKYDVLITYHPSAILRDIKYGKPATAAFLRAKEIIDAI